MRHSWISLAPHIFLGAAVLAASSLDWPRRWIISGAPILTYSWLLGAANGYRVLPFVPLWTLISTLNLIYAVAATSWLLYWCFFAACYPAIFVSWLFQFDAVANVVRKQLRAFLRHLHFIDDKVAFFDLPALEIDTEVNGLMIVRGITLSLSTLTIVAHGIEVSIKLSSDIELALYADDVAISLLRKIDIGNVYCNVKGSDSSLSSGTVTSNSKDMNRKTTATADDLSLNSAPLSTNCSAPPLTAAVSPKAVPIKDLKSSKPLYLSNQQAIEQYQDTLHLIYTTSAIHQSQEDIEQVPENVDSVKRKKMTPIPGNELIAAICSQLHTKPSAPHPPKWSIRVTTVQNLLPVYVRKFLYRLPMLLRLLLNPLSYFHPVKIASIASSASGAWMQNMVDGKIFKLESDDNADTEHLQDSMSSWLSSANFVFLLKNISAWAHVPFLPDFDITNRFKLDDVILYRTLTDEIDLQQVARLGGADASIEIPSFLLPHHGHLLPPRPTMQEEKRQEAELEEIEGKPKVVQAQNDLEQTRNDETNMTISIHGCLPIIIHKDLLEFTIELVKASKIAEMERTPSTFDNNEVHGFREFSKAIGSSIKGNLKKAGVEATNDKMVAKLMEKITTKLETVQGDVGYSGKIALPLKPYRDQADPATKILP